MRALAFPAYAGMFLVPTAASQITKGFPRVCGDVSSDTLHNALDNQLSPRMRGCFLNWALRSERISAFPAYAGMFPLRIMIDSLP